MSIQLLNKEWWDERYKTNTTGWDIGYPSTPIKEYIDQIEEKNLRILIPGAGNAHEARYLLEQGFQFITILDIAPTVVERHKKEFEGIDQIQVIEGDFFKHNGRYDLIFEQTFLCTLTHTRRVAYFLKMEALLENGGKLCGVLFNREFEHNPPYGGNKEEYLKLANGIFKVNAMEECYNSIPERAGTELWINLEKS